MNKTLNFFFSFPFMGFLLLIMAFSMGIATFVENSYGTEAAQALIYKSTWFELVLVLLTINLVVNFFRFRMYAKERISVGIFHISFVFILIGAGITRYISFEGVMHIREGQSSDYILSSEDYLTVKNGNQTMSKMVLFSEITPHQFDETLIAEGRKIRIKSVGFIRNAVRTVKQDPSGEPMIDFVISQGRGRENFVFSKGNSLNMGGIRLGFESPNSNVRFIDKEGKLLLASDRKIEIRSMTGGETKLVNPNDTIPVETMQLYSFDGFMMLVKDYSDMPLHK